MFDYQKLFAPYCREHALPLHLSAVMPVGYQNANGTFDVSIKTVFINAVRLNDAPNHEKALLDFWMPRQAVPVETYNTVFSQIDESISHELFLEEAT